MEVIVNSTYSTALNLGYRYMVCVCKNFIGNSSELCLCVCICHENYYVCRLSCIMTSLNYAILDRGEVCIRLVCCTKCVCGLV